jgi:nucleoid DNA-binding protein
MKGGEMNKAQLVSTVSQKTETKKQAQDIVELILDTIKSTLKKREPVAISGFGTFKVKETKARMGRNPKTGEAIQIPAKKKIAFRVSKELKTAIL